MGPFEVIAVWVNERMSLRLSGGEKGGMAFPAMSKILARLFEGLRGVFVS